MTAMMSSGPPNPPFDREREVTRKKAALWSAVWEASQFLSDDEISDFVDGVLAEIEADAPSDREDRRINTVKTAREEGLERALRRAVRIIARLEGEQVSREGQDFLAEARKVLGRDNPYLRHQRVGSDS